MHDYAHLQYKKTQITTVDRRRLVVLLYEGAVNFLIKAREGIEEKNIEKRHNNINRTLAIIDELKNALNFTQGDEIAKALDALYSFMHRHLVSASIKNDPHMITEVINILSDLNEAWKAIASDPELAKISQDPPAKTSGLRA